MGFGATSQYTFWALGLTTALRCETLLTIIRKVFVKTNRPVNLALGTLKFPPMAIASILHRLSGIGIFILLPYMLCMLHCSLTDAASFRATKALIQHPMHKLIIFVFIAAVIYHLLAGIRHIIMDIGFGESVSAGRASAIAVIALAFIFTLLAGLWLW